ncbi:serine hydrolase [Kitasatospora misakiensis]|uniref:Serine hydrolase n=1 Tax=Kitasatospora misakiensis TaxID=67330 RepID=A0ABW0X4A9_9ACTN
MTIRSVSRARVLVPVCLLVAAGAVVAVLQERSGGVGSSPRMSVVVSDTTSSVPAVATATPAVTPVAVPTASALGADAALRSAVDGAGGTVSVAIADLGTGRSLTYGGSGHGFATASIVKVDILSALLLQAQDDGTRLTDSQRDLAATMIENSDNDAATALWDAIGGETGLNSANARFGLTSTEAGEGGYWGLTSSTADDQLRLLRQVFTGESLLTPVSRAYVQELLDQVEDDQRWGVGAAASNGGFTVKNGWLPRDTDDLWVMNSIGRVERDGHELLIAVVSDGNPSEAEGTALVESVARSAAEALEGA